MKMYTMTVDAPHAEEGTARRTFTTADVIEIANQIAGLAHDNPGKEFTITISAADTPTPA